MSNETNTDDKALPERTAAEAGWHVSRYNVMAGLPGSDKLVIFNTLTRSCGAFAPIELYAMRALGELSEDSPFVHHLARYGVIVNYDERESLEAEGRMASSTPEDDAVMVTICPTMACNFECPYCFEDRGRGKMSPEVQDDVVALVCRMLDASHAGMLRITWFGGEPLLAKDVIESLSQRLIAAADERGCAYNAWIFTNGYLIDQDVVDLLMRCRIEHVHIPLDGVGATNDASRRLVGGGPTFDRIVDNLRLLKPPIRTLIRANTHKGNVAQLDVLKELVSKRAEETGNHISYYAASLVDVSPVDVQGSPMADYAYDGIEVSLRPENRHVSVGVDHSCGAHNLWMVTIDDEGRLYKCGGKSVGKPRFAYATARDWDPRNPLVTASNPDMLAKYLNTCVPLSDEECRECAWLPMCGGGCPHLRLFGKHKCPAYRNDPEPFVRAMYERTRR